MKIRSKSQKAARAGIQRPASPSNASKATFGCLRAPYSRSDLAMIRQAVNQGWPVGAEARRQIANGVLATKDTEGTNERARKSTEQTLNLIRQKEWIR